MNSKLFDCPHLAAFHVTIWRSWTVCIQRWNEITIWRVVLYLCRIVVVGAIDRHSAVLGGRVAQTQAVRRARPPHSASFSLGAQMSGSRPFYERSRIYSILFMSNILFSIHLISLKITWKVINTKILQYYTTTYILKNYLLIERIFSCLS